MEITYDKKTEIRNLAGVIEHEARSKECDVKFMLSIIDRLHTIAQGVKNENQTNK